MRYPVWQICLICGLLLLLSGCAPLVQNDQPSRTGWVPLAAGQTVGQTITARFQGLQGINFHLSPDQPGDGVIQLTVHSRTANPEVLATSQLPLKQLTSPGWYRFNFPPIQNSNQQEYELILDLEGSGSARVAKGPGESYLEGALSQNGTAVDAQAAFRLAYDRGQAFIGLAGEGLSWLLYLLAAALLFFLPGWALLALALPGWSERAWTEKLGLAGGLSLAVYPVLFLWTYILGLHAGKFYAWLPPLIGAAILIWLFIRKPDKRLFHVKNPGWDNLLPDLAFAAILLLLIFSRLWPIRGLTAPLWGDSLQHTMIAQLLVDHNGLFTSWAPYAELVTFTYHFGFHSFVAVFHWLSGLSLAGSTLWTGQIVNLIAILGLVPLANRLAPNRWTAALTILVAGLLTSIPQIYLNWGRYTQLAGQAILLCALYLSWELLERKEILWSVTVLAWVALAGVALSHYRVVIFAVLFLVAYFLIYFRKAGAWRLIKRIFIIGLGGALLYLPWFLRAFSGTLLRILSSFLHTPAGQISAGVQEDLASFTLTSYVPAILWLLLILAVAWGFWRRSREAILIVLWSFLCLLAANPQWLRLPGTGAIRTFTVIIAAYIPVAILLGAAGGWLISSLTHSRLRKTSQRLILLAILACLMGLSLWSVRSRLNDIDEKQFGMLTGPDQRAAEWIKNNLPEDASFLINSMPAFSNSLVVGNDGGWWLPLSAGRRVNVPPITYFAERGPRPDYIEWVNQLTANVLQKGINDPAVLQELQNRNISYIYLGQQQGRVNNPGPRLEPDELLSSGNFTPVYHQDRVWIFKRDQP